MTATMTNRKVEGAAIAFVIQHEASAGRSALDSRGQGAAGDLVSGDRVIEVEANARPGVAMPRLPAFHISGN